MEEFQSSPKSAPSKKKLKIRFKLIFTYEFYLTGEEFKNGKDN